MILYFTSTSTRQMKASMRAGIVGYIASPRHFSLPTGNIAWGMDNGCFVDDAPERMHARSRGGTPKTVGPKGYDEALYIKRMEATTDRAPTCKFVNAPDVFGDIDATLVRSEPWLPRIRAYGYPAGLVAQDGCTVATLALWWDKFDTLFLGGTDAFKTAQARALVGEAKRRNKWCHLGRCNSLKRLRWAEAIGCDSADGTKLAFMPDKALKDWLRWVNRIQNHTALFDMQTEDLFDNEEPA